MIGSRAPVGIYEGAFASRNPYGSLAPNSVVGATDIATGRFGWLDPTTSEASNVASPGFLIGLVQPRWGSWGLTYVRFPNGANIGASVFADPATGIAYAADGGGFELTKWKAVTSVRPGALGIISPYAFIS